MSVINLNNLRKILPSDILNLLAMYLDSKTVTILNKKIRDNYFQKNNAVVNCEDVDASILSGDFLSKFNITLKYFSYANQSMVFKYLPPEAFNQITIIEECFIRDLKSVLERFPKLKIINGVISACGSNLELLPGIKGNMAIAIINELDLEGYRKFSLPNLIYIPYQHCSTDIDVTNLENKIHTSPNFYIKKDGVYSNLETLVCFASVHNISTKKLTLPKLKKLIISDTTSPKNWQIYLQDTPLLYL